MTIPTVRLKTVVPSRGPWIYRKMVDAADPRTEPGAIVRVQDREGGFVAQAFWNPKSELALRVLTRAEDPVVDDAWLRRTVARLCGHTHGSGAGVSVCVPRTSPVTI